MDAATTMDLKQRAVHCADDVTSISIKKLVRSPVQRSSGMWTTIHIGEYLFSPANHKTLTSARFGW